jgi:NAD(P)-dependent dehydrogenase (short-subunit alcohol dehydrogenase family)
MKTALITGSTRGIGLAIARQLSDRGVHVIIASRDAERASSMANHRHGHPPTASAKPPSTCSPSN